MILLGLAALASAAMTPQRFDLRADQRSLSVAVPEGNYRVTLRYDRGGAATVRAEARRLMLHAERLPARAIRSFVVNVRTPALMPPPANAPGGTAVRLNPREAGSPSWDDRLTLEFAGAVPATVEVTPATVPTIYLAGDSTVADQRYEPAASWGQMLPALFGDKVAVANHAESGETLKSFLTGLRLDKILERIGPGDLLLIQFGHNDQKTAWPQTYAEAGTTYAAYLRAYLAEARRRGAQPVLVTSPERRTFEGARIRSTLAEHVAAVKRVAAEEGVPLIDLNAASRTMYEALGPERAPLAFNDGGRDATHHNSYGAWLLARAVAEGLRGTGLLIARHLADLPRFDPAAPPPPESFRLPPSGAASDIRPAGD